MSVVWCVKSKRVTMQTAVDEMRRQQQLAFQRADVVAKALAEAECIQIIAKVNTYINTQAV